MAEEAERIETWARIWDDADRKDATRWSHFNFELVIGAGVLSAAAASTGLTKSFGGVGTGLLALAAAILSAVATALRPATMSAQFNTAASANSGLADSARVFRTTVVDYLSIQDVIMEFKKLCDRRDTVVTNAPISRAPWRRSGVPQVKISAWPLGKGPGNSLLGG